MIDIRALATRAEGRTGPPVFHERARRVRISERCVLDCAGCTARVRWHATLEPPLVEHELRSLAPDARRVLFAGADPLLAPCLDDAVAQARSLGLAVEILTPGVLLTPDRCQHLSTLGVDRVRVVVGLDEEEGAHGIPPGRLQGAANARAAGLHVDLQIALGGQPVDPELLRECLALPFERILIADDGCQGAPALPQSVAAATVRTAVALMGAESTGSLCLDSLALHPRLLLEVVEAQVPPAVARSVEACLRDGLST